MSRHWRLVQHSCLDAKLWRFLRWYMERDRPRWPQKVVLAQPNNYLTPLENSYQSVNDLSFRKGRRRSVIYPPENKYIMMEDQLARIVRRGNIIRSDSFKCIVLHTIFYLCTFIVNIYFLLVHFNIFLRASPWQNYCFFFFTLKPFCPITTICFRFLIFIYHVFFYHNAFFIVIFVTIKFVLKLFFPAYEKNYFYLS